MCIAILNAKGTLSLKTFKNCWEANPDGAGLCYYDGERIQIIKEMKSVKSLHKQYVSIREKFPAVDIAIHFRIATHGRVNSTNCHPFKVNKNTAFIHNGIISNVGTNPDFSDTYIFNETILKALPSTFIKNTAILELLGAYIGYSKIVVISGEFSTIINEELGHWDAGNWYSNKSYIAPKKSSAVSTYGQRWGWDGYGDDWDGWDYKSKGQVNAKPCDDKCDEFQPDNFGGICECCREDAERLNYVANWAMNMCNKCCDEFKADIYIK